jgi:hypothetical protein
LVLADEIFGADMLQEHEYLRVSCLTLDQEILD